MVRIQVFLLPKMSICCRKFALMGTSLSMIQPTMPKTIAHGMRTAATECTHTRPSLVFWGAKAPKPKRLTPIIMGATNWIKETPKLPMPAWMPRAVPAMRFGKKYPVEGMNPENTPPPIPPMKDRTMNHQNGVLVSCTAMNHPNMGMTKRKEEMETSFRVPTMGGRNMKTRRKSPPESPEIEAIQYNCPLEK